MHALVDVVAQYLIFVVMAVAAVAGLLLRGSARWQLILRSVLAIVAMGILIEIASHAYHDTRPFVAHHFRPYFSHPADNGFPSDHTVAASLIAVMFWPYRRVLAPILFACAVLIGSARVVAGVHSPIDIIGGALIGVLAALIGHLAGRVIWARWGAGVWVRWSAKRRAAAGDPAGAFDAGRPAPDGYEPTHSRAQG